MRLLDSKELAWKIRRHAIEMTHLSHGSHIGSILSIADIVAVLYSDILNINPKDSKNNNRDRFILSKGHAGAAVYAALAEKGFFTVDVLKTHYQNGSILSGHVSHKNVNGVELSTGSLGHGLGVACGISFSGKYKQLNYKTFVVLGDGECEEGSVWEAALFANHYKLDNLITIIDNNNLQSLTTCDNTISLGNLCNKWESFGWDVYEIDGHNHDILRKTIENCILNSNGKPKCIVAKTVKGKGISFMENKVLWHYRDPQGQYYLDAVSELEKSR